MESILCLLLSAVLLVLGIFQLRGKGVPFNNAYLFASSKERETMNKAPYYRQSGIVFLLLGAAFLSFALSIQVPWKGFFWAGFGLMGATLIYAVISTICIGRKG